jgi:hypothetical protein
MKRRRDCKEKEYTSALKIKIETSSEASVSTHKTPRCHNPVDHHLNNYPREYLKTSMCEVWSRYFITLNESRIKLFSLQECIKNATGL